ncbi:5-(carboxyamino)imidazole ribonucleotide synthase [Taklimakanibacter lacteus]|uniref:5-(carboxyamino)imidazole ribonucleotide synthase n=1 Tax=Taklimakanibacter lacteus TaxID=2268456 RepID=UPI000E6601FE
MRLSRPLPPNSVIGILGGGQLGRMLTLAAARLGLRCHIYAPEPDSPAFQVSAHHICAAYDDSAALEAFASAVDVVTYEFENVPAETAAILGRLKPLAPGAEALATSQDRLVEKTFLTRIGLETAPFAPVDDPAGLAEAVALIGRPAILKTRRFGYDGKGQTTIRADTALDAAWAQTGGRPAILEGFVAFEKEVSVIAARGWDGAVAVYDVPENRHANHILHQSIVPAAIAPETAEAARDIARRITAALDYVGIIGVELFLSRETGRERLIVNEIAPRVHNSGHWTMDACLISQFEQHIRAVAGWPLGGPERHSDVVMTNLLGDDAAGWQDLAREPRTAIHLYGKAESRPGRKMGHVNRLTPRQD